ncbi:unnamed protein product [Echinostoma caproni]|uniref:Uncharacterized protein n=1 Tax=Echinostoma caproni TaxID=27848 RepID=A0A183AG86_9TREM|nr:unnamed protein product [Echinostoma caproni]
MLVLAKTKTLAVPPRPTRDRGPGSNKSCDPVNEVPTKLHTLDSRQDSNNSVYFNMWEAGDGEDDSLTAPPLLPNPNPNVSAAPTVLSRRPQGATCNSRVYRRSQLVTSDYHPLPSLTQSMPMASQHSVASSMPRTEAPCLPGNKPLPPPRAPSTVISAVTSATQPGYQSGPNTLVRAPSIEACVPFLRRICTISYCEDTGFGASACTIQQTGAVDESYPSLMVFAGVLYRLYSLTIMNGGTVSDTFTGGGGLLIGHNVEVLL